MSDWNARRILKDLADDKKRRTILTAFWRFGDAQSKMLAQAHLARSLHFRDETIRKMPPEKKADLLASRIGVSEFDQFLEMALMQHHTNEAKALMGAFLDEWKVPHVDGSIETDDYATPDAAKVRAAVTALKGKFEENDVLLYLATAGLLMGDDWRAGTWPVVDEQRD
jgi:hypothetical protein